MGGSGLFVHESGQRYVTQWSPSSAIPYRLPADGEEDADSTRLSESGDGAKVPSSSTPGYTVPPPVLPLLARVVFTPFRCMDPNSR